MAQERQPITMMEYSAKMDEIIGQGKSVPDTLIAMLEEASKYEIKEEKC